MRVTQVPVLVFATAFVGAAIALGVSQALELVPRCNVYTDGCISISAAGRYPPAVHFFRGFIIPHAVLLMPLWLLMSRWLARLEVGSNSQRRFISITGMISPVFLIYYIVVLGEDGVLIENTRLIAVRIFFVSTLLVQLVTSGILLKSARDGTLRVSVWLPAALLATSILGSLAAAASVPIQMLHPDPSEPLNLMQWHASTAFIIWFLLVWPLWRATALSLEIRTVPREQVRSESARETARYAATDSR